LFAPGTSLGGARPKASPLAGRTGRMSVHGSSLLIGLLLKQESAFRKLERSVCPTVPTRPSSRRGSIALQMGGDWRSCRR
jgi:hypothetical protein